MPRLQSPWIVIGAKGMLGRDLMLHLKQARIEAVGLDLEEVNIRDPNHVMDALRTFRDNLVINVAAFTDVDGCESQQETAFAVNARGPENVARACKQTGAFLVHISTDYVFDGRKGTPYLEDDAMNPLGVYAKSKAEGERLVRAILPDRHCIVRTQWLFGVHGKNFVEAILGMAKQKDVLTVVDDQHGCPTSTLDLSKALIQLGKLEVQGTYHVTNSGATTWYGFAKKIVELAGITTVRVEPITTAQLARPAPRPAYSVLDNAKFVRLVGKRLPKWEDALAEYMRHREEMLPTKIREA